MLNTITSVSGNEHMTRHTLAFAVLIAAHSIAALPCRAEVVVGEDFFYQETTVLPTSFGDVRFARQNYGGGQSGPAGAWDERWSGFGSGTIISDDTTSEPFMSHPFESRFNGENSVNNDIRRDYVFANSVGAEQTLYFSGRFFASMPNPPEQAMFAEIGILSPSNDGGATKVSIGMQGNTFFGRAGLAGGLPANQTVLGNPMSANDFTNNQMYHRIVGKLELNVAPNTIADYNGNGSNDTADYVVWRNNNGLMGGATLSQGDGNADGNVDQTDYNIWRANYESRLDRLTVYINPTGVETSNGSTLVALGEVANSLKEAAINPRMFISGGFQMQGESFVDDVVIGTTWNDVTSLNVPRLTAQVNTTNGNVTLLNNTSTAIDLAYYEILSDMGSLNTSWNSLDDQNIDGGEWVENNPTANGLRESNLTGSTTLTALGGSLVLPSAFVTTGQQDLLIRWGTKQGAIGLLNLVGSISYAPGAALGSSSPVPEPSSIVLFVILGICLGARRHIHA